VVYASRESNQETRL